MKKIYFVILLVFVIVLGGCSLNDVEEVKNDKNNNILEDNMVFVGHMLIYENEEQLEDGKFESSRKVYKDSNTECLYVRMNNGGYPLLDADGLGKGCKNTRISKEEKKNINLIAEDDDTYEEKIEKDLKEIYKKVFDSGNITKEEFEKRLKTLRK